MVSSSTNTEMANQMSHLGTVGHVDPEYTRTGEFQTHCDVSIVLGYGIRMIVCSRDEWHRVLLWRVVQSVIAQSGRVV